MLSPGTDIVVDCTPRPALADYATAIIIASYWRKNDDYFTCLITPSLPLPFSLALSLLPHARVSLSPMRYVQGPVGRDSALMAEELIIRCTRYEESISAPFTRGERESIRRLIDRTLR